VKLNIALKNLDLVRVLRSIAVLLIAGSFVGCASKEEVAQSGDEMYSINDPYEDINRVTFEFNQGLDNVIIGPIARSYIAVVPQWGRERVNDTLNNLGEPVNFANSVLQLDIERAITSFVRFGFNSTFGIAGLFDIAGEMGLERADEDFGQTLSVWGFGEGPYVVVPFFGPSSPRDGIGMATDMLLLDPFSRALRSHEKYQKMIARGIDQRAAYNDELETLESTSIDFYAAMRELYRQHRLDKIRNGDVAPGIPIPSITFDDSYDQEISQASSSDSKSSE